MNHTLVILLSVLALFSSCSFEGGIFDSNTAVKTRIQQLEQENTTLQQEQKQLQNRNHSLKNTQEKVRSQY